MSAFSAHPDVRGSSGPHARDYDFSLFFRDVVNHAETAVPKPDAVQVAVSSQRDRTFQKGILRKLKNGSDGSVSFPRFQKLELAAGGSGELNAPVCIHSPGARGPGCTGVPSSDARY